MKRKTISVAQMDRWEREMEEERRKEAIARAARQPLTVAEVAECLQVSERVVIYQITSGWLKASPTYEVDRADYAAFMSSCQVPPPAPKRKPRRNG